MLEPLSEADTLKDLSVISNAIGALRVGPAVLAKGAPRGPLTGLRLVVKDVIDVAGQKTGAGNPMFLADAPIADAHAPSVTRLVEAGATVIGKAHTDEFAFSLSGTNVHYGTPINSHAPDRIPGGSSSGCAAAIGGGLAEIGLATDTGGSIRIPAAYCGIAGFRPTHGRVPVSRVIPLAQSFDTVGLLAIDGPTLHAAGQVLLQTTSCTQSDVGHLVIADDLLVHADPEVATAVLDAIYVLSDILGVTVERSEITRGQLTKWVTAFQKRQLLEAWANHGSWIESRQPDLGPGVRSRFNKAALTRDQPPLEDLNVIRDQVCDTVVEALGSGGILALPSAPTLAPRLNESARFKQELRDRTLALTCIAGLGGLPAISLPLGDVEGLPVGVCLLARRGSDELLLSAASKIDPQMQRPPVRNHRNI